MKSKHFVHTAFVLGLVLIAADVSYGQAPPATLRLTSKVRDFRELPDAKLPSSIPNYHPDFNTFAGCPGNGYVDAAILTTGATDTANFPNDNRNPKLINAKAGCFTSFDKFDDWYNDKDTETNRPFLYDLVFNRTAGGTYEYINSNFFPLDNDSLTKIDNATGKFITRNLKGANLATFGHENTGANAAHDFGFTMEFHANFTYIASSDPVKQQVFNFTGDDDVWVFINGKLAIDLGGVHAALSKSITLDTIQEARLGLENGKSYLLDFFIAERHITQSNCRITTSLVLETQKVATPVATPPGSAFNSLVAVTLSDATPDAKIYYTTNGNTPDSTSTLYTGQVSIISTTTLKAIAYKTGWTKSDVMTTVYTKTYVPSTLEILDTLGFALKNGYLSEDYSSYMIKVVTSQAGLNSTTAAATTKVSLDQETVNLAAKGQENGNFVFTGTSPFVISTATINNSKTEAAGYDSLIVRWVNPNDPTRDIAEKRILVRPSPKQGKVYFSSNANGTDTVDQYTGTETKLYVVVLDQVLPTGAKPVIVLESTPFGGGGRTKDTLTVNLVATATPGKYIAVVNVDNTSPNSVADNIFQLLLNDQIQATYKDPVDGESVTANAGYGVAPEIAASLQFTDKNGNVLPDGFYFSPADGLLYITYKDDWDNGAITTKKVTLSITNNSGKAGADAESTFTVTLVPAEKSGSTGVWKGTFSLKDGPAITKFNNTAETYVLGDIIASIPTHNKTGVAGALVTDELLVAYGNQDPTITIEGPNGPGAITRNDDGVKIIIKDQSLSSARDTLYATLSCTESKDVVVNIMLIEKADKPGEYESVIISKSEGASIVDGTLQCQSRDFVKVSYKDPVYGDTKEVQVPIDQPVTTRLYFSSQADGSDEITSVNDLTSDFFYAVVLARSPDVSKVDNFPVTFTTTQGESETFIATETGPFTQKFIVKVPIAFVTGAIAPNNDILEGKITAKEVNNDVTANGAVTVENVTAKANIDLVAGFAPVEKAYIKDTDGDGRGDKVYIVFEKKLGRLPTTVSAQWDSGGVASQTATGVKLSFLNSDSLVVVADYTGSQFAAGHTAASATNPPKALLPNDALFKGQNPVIDDSIGPVLLSVIKRPANVNTLTSNDPSFNLDTLFVTVSEPLKTADFKTMIKTSSSCADYASAKTIVATNNPTLSTDPTKPNEYIVIVDNTTGISPVVGNCIFLNADANLYTDNPGNQPPKYGVVLAGDNRARIIQVFRGFPPVAGLNPNNPNFQVAVQDSRDSTKQGYATPDSKNPGSYQVEWIPPVGFQANGTNGEDYTFNPYTATLNDLPSGSRELTDFQPIPTNLSAIQVVSTTAYIAHISIFDNYGTFVRNMVQVFGGRGELQNTARTVPKGVVSFLVWDKKDKNGQEAGQGVYVWKVSFEFKGGKQEIQYTRTGVLRTK